MTADPGRSGGEGTGWHRHGPTSVLVHREGPQSCDHPQGTYDEQATAILAALASQERGE